MERSGSTPSYAQNRPHWHTQPPFHPPLPPAPPQPPGTHEAPRGPLLLATLLLGTFSLAAPAIFLLLAIAIAILWWILEFVFYIPLFMSEDGETMAREALDERSFWSPLKAAVPWAGGIYVVAAGLGFGMLLIIRSGLRTRRWNTALQAFAASFVAMVILTLATVGLGSVLALIG